MWSNHVPRLPTNAVHWPHARYPITEPDRFTVGNGAVAPEPRLPNEDVPAVSVTPSTPHDTTAAPITTSTKAMAAFAAGRSRDVDGMAMGSKCRASKVKR